MYLAIVQGMSVYTRPWLFLITLLVFLVHGTSAAASTYRVPNASKTLMPLVAAHADVDIPACSTSHSNESNHRLHRADCLACLMSCGGAIVAKNVPGNYLTDAAEPLLEPVQVCKAEFIANVPVRPPRALDA